MVDFVVVPYAPRRPDIADWWCRAATLAPTPTATYRRREFVLPDGSRHAVYAVEAATTADALAALAADTDPATTPETAPDGL